MRILIMGLPGSGKTTLAKELVRCLQTSDSVDWLNADAVRRTAGDWDFSRVGRLRQGRRMAELADQSTANHVVADFVTPLPEMREAFRADLVVWVDTLERSRFPDTDEMFFPPADPDFRIQEQDAAKWASRIAEAIRMKVGNSH